MSTGPETSEPNANAPDDHTLVDQTLDGDLDAFAQLVQRHRTVVYRVVARIVGPDEAEDVAQDAFLRAFHRLDRFRGAAPFRSWVLRIAHNAAVDALARRREIPLENDETHEESILSPATSPRTPAERLEQSERRSRLALKVRQLRESHRAVLVLRDLEGLSYEEIAEITETPLGSVKGRLYRARQELVELLEQNTYDWELPGR